MVKLIIVRHGETIENINGICQGQTDGTLSEFGKQQNKLLSLELNTVKIDKIYSSPLKRAFETAKEINRYHNIEIELSECLSEWYLGDLQGKIFPTDFNINNLDDHMENATLVKKRLLLILKKITSNHTNETVLLVSHGLTIKVLISIIKNISIDRVHQEVLMDNSDFRIFTINRIYK